MLKPPGSSSNRNRAYASSRRKTVAETPEDVLRQLQRLPPNKRCADCNSKLPQCVNLSVGIFVCISCAGIHRELNNRVKGLGHSSFTEEEANRMKETDNEKVNNVWLARYNPQQERMKPPQGNQNQQALRAWIRRKYQDKAWHQGGGGQGGGRGGPGPGPQRRPPPPSQGGRQRRPPQQRPHQPQPTVVQIPPSQPPPPSAAAPVDLFGGFGGPAPAPAPIPISAARLLPPEPMLKVCE